MVSVVKLNCEIMFNIPSVVMLRVILLSVVAPFAVRSGSRRTS